VTLFYSSSKSRVTACTGNWYRYNRIFAAPPVVWEKVTATTYENECALRI